MSVNWVPMTVAEMQTALTWQMGMIANVTLDSLEMEELAEVLITVAAISYWHMVHKQCSLCFQMSMSAQLGLTTATRMPGV